MRRRRLTWTKFGSDLLLIDLVDRRRDRDAIGFSLSAVQRPYLGAPALGNTSYHQKTRPRHRVPSADTAECTRVFDKMARALASPKHRVLVYDENTPPCSSFNSSAPSATKLGTASGRSVSLLSAIDAVNKPPTAHARRKNDVVQHGSVASGDQTPLSRQPADEESASSIQMPPTPPTSQSLPDTQKEHNVNTTATEVAGQQEKVGINVWSALIRTMANL